jgi:hypothetical protein
MTRRKTIALSALLLLTGSALSGAEQQPSPGQIATAPRIGRVEGRVLDLPKVPGLPDVVVRSVKLELPGGGRDAFAEATVGEDGRFVIENVPASPVQLRPVFEVGRERLRVESPPFSYSTLVYEGKTTQVALFGKGRPVTGTLALPGGVKPQGVRVGLALVAPPRRAMQPSREGALPNPLAEVFHRLQPQKPLDATVDADGRFRIEGVREGTYDLTATAARAEDGNAVRLRFDGKAQPSYPSVENGRLTVYLMAGGERTEPLDVGLLHFGMP